MVDVQSEIGFTSLFSLHVESSRECYVAKERLSRARSGGVLGFGKGGFTLG